MGLLFKIFKNMTKLNYQKIINDVQANFLKKTYSKVEIGDNIKVGLKIIEGNKERVQFFEGVVLSKKNNSINTTFTVRKVLDGIGVERVFLIHSPKLDSIKVLRSAKVRKSKLYYLRNLKGKASRLKQRFN